MRTELENRDGERGEYVGTFVRKGRKKTYRGSFKETVLLRGVRTLDGKPVCDHLWFNYTKGFENLGTIQKGEKIRFTARSKSYQKGYQGWKWNVERRSEKDYRLSHPSKVERYKG